MDPVLLDPVLQVSYERAALLAHLARSPLEPTTRAPLAAKDLVRNLGLQQARGQGGRGGGGVIWGGRGSHCTPVGLSLALALD